MLYVGVCRIIELGFHFLKGALLRAYTVHVRALVANATVTCFGSETTFANVFAM